MLAATVLLGVLFCALSVVAIVYFPLLAHRKSLAQSEAEAARALSNGHAVSLLSRRSVVRWIEHVQANLLFLVGLLCDPFSARQ